MTTNQTANFASPKDDPEFQAYLAEKERTTYDEFLRLKETTRVYYLTGKRYPLLPRGCGSVCPHCGAKETQGLGSDALYHDRVSWDVEGTWYQCFGFGCHQFFKVRR